MAHHCPTLITKRQGRNVIIFLLQLDWLATADWAYADIFAIIVRFQNHDRFWIRHQKLHRVCMSDYFEKPQNELFWPFMAFWAILVPESIFVWGYQVVASTRVMCVKLVLCLRV